MALSGNTQLFFRYQRSSSWRRRRPWTLTGCGTATGRPPGGGPSCSSCCRRWRWSTPCTSTPWSPFWRSSACHSRSRCLTPFLWSDWRTLWTHWPSTSITMAVQVSTSLQWLGPMCPVYLCVQMFSSYKNTSQIGWGPILNTSFYFLNSCLLVYSCYTMLC